MAQGWAGLSMVCYATPLEAARMSCAGLESCLAVEEKPFDRFETGALLFQTKLVETSTVMAVQPCERLDATFFSSLLPVVIPAAVAILCAKRLYRMFDSHA